MGNNYTSGCAVTWWLESVHRYSHFCSAVSQIRSLFLGQKNKLPKWAKTDKERNQNTYKQNLKISKRRLPLRDLNVSFQSHITWRQLYFVCISGISTLQILATMAHFMLKNAWLGFPLLTVNSITTEELKIEVMMFVSEGRNLVFLLCFSFSFFKTMGTYYLY